MIVPLNRRIEARGENRIGARVFWGNRQHGTLPEPWHLGIRGRRNRYTCLLYEKLRYRRIHAQGRRLGDSGFDNAESDRVIARILRRDTGTISGTRIIGPIAVTGLL